ncbi:hypothetical protein HD806DRAFT_540766 [Xylariaceae sp. AK1471]|nr:hypothetical protein HD806DRAFT_540766 [Xylariaceae sp. AK1471]
MAALPESDVAASTSIFSFLKTFGYIWGVTAPSIIFNAVFNQNLFRIHDPQVRGQLRDRGAYAYVSQASATRHTLDTGTWEEVAEVYITSLRAVWCFGLALSLLGFLVVFIEKRIELRTELQTEFGLAKEATDSGTKEIDATESSNNSQNLAAAETD